ncbi:MAG: AbrB family transcriptional regulator [Rhodobacterales bacterium]|nr:AbrB family transcriptional regulator [Rhodobacterales bacterium]
MAILLALGLGAAGGAVALWLALPLGMLLGSLVAVGAVTATGLRPLGRVPQIPQHVRNWLIPIVGVAIGGSFTPQILREMPGWAGSLLALAVYLPVAHAIGYLIYRRMGAIDRPTACFASVPGGLIECLVLGEEAGADIRVLTLLAALRLAAVATAAMLVLAAALAFALSGVVGQPLAAVFLAFAPGGVAEMSLIALSLQVSVVYVTAHHVARILLTVMLARIFARRVLSRGP